jgi:hypothetical protein
MILATTIGAAIEKVPITYLSYNTSRPILPSMDGSTNPKPGSLLKKSTQLETTKRQCNLA